jgi:hypothetical protein
MNELTPSNVYSFLKRFALKGATLRRFQIQQRSARSSSATLLLSATDATKQAKVRLKLTFEGVEEFRFQRRPGPPLLKLKDVQIGFFGPLTFLNLDAFIEDGPPKLMDFRASDWFIGGLRLYWEVVEKKG